MKTKYKGKHIFRQVGMIVFIICFLILVRKYEIGIIPAFFLLSCPCMLAYSQGLTENIQKEIKKRKDGTDASTETG